ncbi:Dyp-type peroxidase [Lyngbya aestuarii]|uniref:Dyp-type peroxidase n=1 Tax=Lyngbya aestuarii TaxID=118322 RepID=UPI00403DEE4D
MSTLELNDIQGLIVRGYSQLLAARFVLLKIENPKAAKQWLSTLAPQLQNSQERPSETCLNIAFTYEGLKSLGLNEQILTTFSPEFREGMSEPYRRRILGDHGESAPELWEWGGPNTTSVDILLMLYATDQAKLATFYKAYAQDFASGGVEEILKLETFTLMDEEGRFREHFGFRDGVSQPTIEGLSRVGSPDNTVKAGEFILGYPNEYGLYTERPMVKAQQDQQSILPEDSEGSGNHDLGRNGSYLVFRQLGQKVQEFWHFLDKVTQEQEGTSNPEASLKLASKIVGRWPSGTPLVTSPDQDDPSLENNNDFAYHHLDPHGLKCPLGAHIRRSNPRDSLDPKPGTEKSIAVNKTHRLLRRGRTYGKPIAASLEPQELLKGDSSGERGLHFICVNANIARQFEFVQQTWINNPKFSGMYSDTDPLIGDRHPGDLGLEVTFTEQATPVRKRLTGLPEFVVVRGGAYFFLPGIRAFRYLMSI